MPRLTFIFVACFFLAVLGCANVGQRISSKPGNSAVPVAESNESGEAIGAGRETTVTTAQSQIRRVAFQDDIGQDDIKPHDLDQHDLDQHDLHQHDLGVENTFMEQVDPGISTSTQQVAPMPERRLSETTNTYSLADIEQIALSNNPAISTALATTGISSGLYRQVGTRPNPVLGYFGQQLADRNTDQNGLFIEQEVVRGNKLELNRKVLGHTNRAQQMEVETQRYRVLTDVRERFFEALAAQQQYDATQDFQHIAQQGVNVAKERQGAEEGTLVETLQAQTLLSEVVLAAEQAAVAYRGAWRELAAIAGLPIDSPVRLDEDFTSPMEPLDLDLTYARIISQSPELAVAQAIVCEKHAILQRQHVQAVPNITGQLGVGHDRATNHGMINVQVAMPLPIHNKNSGNISAAHHDYVRATHEVQRIKQSIRSRLARAMQDFDTSLAAVRKYEDEILPQARESLEVSEQAYLAGELGFLQVLIIRRSFYDASLRLIKAKGQLAQAAARVDGLLLTGGLEPPKNYTAGDGLRGASFGGQ